MASEQAQQLAAVLGEVARVLRIPVSELNERSGVHNTLGWDSLRHMELMVALEKKLGVKFSMAELVRLNSVEKILQRLGAR